jgi:NADH-ubiquinone oxidoreductase chain 6
LGGLLVLFIYVTSLASNEIFSLSTTTIIPLILGTLIILTILITLDSSFIASGINNSEGLNIISNLFYHEESSSSLTKLYNGPTRLITLTLVLYLFLTLIAVVKITKINQGPLRKRN